MRFRSIVGFCVIISMLSACGVTKAVPKIAKIIVDPDTPVGEADERPSEIALHAFAAADANPNFQDEPAPTIIRIFALSSDHRLYGNDFFTLVEAPADGFGVTLIEELDEQQIEPDSYRIFGPYEIPKKAKYIGVIAEYYDIETADWRSSIKIDSVGSDERLLMLLLEEEVRLIREAG